MAIRPSRYTILRQIWTFRRKRHVAFQGVIIINNSSVVLLQSSSLRRMRHGNNKVSSSGGGQLPPLTSGRNTSAGLARLEPGDLGLNGTCRERHGGVQTFSDLVEVRLSGSHRHESVPFGTVRHWFLMPDLLCNPAV